MGSAETALREREREKEISGERGSRRSEGTGKESRRGLLKKEKSGQRRNFQRELDQMIERNEKAGIVPTLFLHSCCAPCSSYVLEYLSRYFRITVCYYNPNIYPPKEYGERTSEVERLIRELPAVHPIAFTAGEYRPEQFYEAVRGHEGDPEGGGRCGLCFELRLREAARLAREGGFDYFATTLTISPMKDAERLNRIGEELGEEYGVTYLCSDFKKKNGYRRSTELSREYGLYRQDYCGCVFSMRERDERKKKAEEERRDGQGTPEKTAAEPFQIGSADPAAGGNIGLQRVQIPGDGEFSGQQASFAQAVKQF